MSLIGLSRNGSCSVIMTGVFVRFAARNAKRPLAGFQTCTCMRSIFSSLMARFRSLMWAVSFLCLTGRRMTLMSSFSRFATHLSRVSYGPQQIIGLNFLRSRNLASKYI